MIIFRNRFLLLGKQLDSFYNLGVNMITPHVFVHPILF